MRPPSLWSSAWECSAHGAVAPLHVHPPTSEALAHVAARSGVPVWLPIPAPRGWCVSGVGWAGDERSGAVASVVALSGPSPLGGAADLAFVAEEPGVGLGASLAGLVGPDPGAAVEGRPEAKLPTGGRHPVALWATGTATDRCAFVGEAEGVWLWAVVWPEAAHLVLLERLELRDLRGRVIPPLELGAPTARLADVPGSGPSVV